MHGVCAWSRFRPRGTCGHYHASEAGYSSSSRPPPSSSPSPDMHRAVDGSQITEPLKSQAYYGSLMRVTLKLIPCSVASSSSDCLSGYYTQTNGAVPVQPGL
ncbi:unnamed protein product [Pleuronectes platessa]|uniref:Uncharacterized protein n=1 Tax=Pleuronectes platessa TaxID=8262 RepID=A0A9N7TLW9_PLEPL|nr:unnamed protein product [Pleuronectes platessa]